MSAFLFVISDKAVKESTDIELEGMRLRFKKTVDTFDWSKHKMCDFSSDQASGHRAGLFKVEFEQKLRAGLVEGKDRPDLLVPGYNPRKDSE